MYSTDEYKKFKFKYGSYASWAIWDDNLSDPSIIDKNISHLHSKFVLLGLNISGPLDNKPWLNFHKGPSNVRKLKYACLDNILWGSYITDLFKDIPQKDSSELKKILTKDLIEENVNRFNEEMRAIKISENSTFIIFGNAASYYFNKYFRKGLKNSVIYHYHYSHYGVSDRGWVSSLWNKLKIHQDYDLTIKKIDN